MNKILCDLYDGQLCPRDHRSEDPGYAQSLADEAEAVQALEKHLGVKKDLLDAVLDTVCRRTCFEVDDAFCQGFRVAFQLAAEALL